MIQVVQNHIHLSTELGGSPENAPTLKWRVTERAEISITYVEVGETLGGYTFADDLLDDVGNSLLKTDFRFRIKVKADGSSSTYDLKAALKAMHGKAVYFVDNEHPNDSENHAAYVRPMRLIAMSEFTSEEDKLLRFYYVDIQLKDMSRSIP